MFFRSKSKKSSTDTPQGAGFPPLGEEKPNVEEKRTWFSLSDAPKVAQIQPSSLPPQSTPRNSDTHVGLPAIEAVAEVAAAGSSAMPGSDSQSKTEKARQFALALGQITTVAVHSKHHQGLTLSEFRVRVVPAMLAGQFALASRRDEKLGVQTPVTALLWACVSDAVDLRLSGGDSGEIKLDRSEWSNGSNVWIVDVFGDQTMLPGLLRRLGETQWNSRPVKMFVREVDGRSVVRVMNTA